MTRYRTDIEVRGDQVAIRTDLRKAPDHLHGPIVNALGAHLDVEVSDHNHSHDHHDHDHSKCGHTHSLRKAKFDPRYPELETLLRQAQRDWDRSGRAFVDALHQALRRGALLPLTAENERLLMELFRDHYVRLEVQFAGRTRDRDRMRRLVREGLVAPNRATIPITFRLARGLEQLQHTGLSRRPTEDLEQLVRRALAVELTREDRYALDYARRMAAIHIRNPGRAQANAAERVLTQAEMLGLRDIIASGIEDGASPRQVERALRDNVRDPRFQNDWERVSVTELQNAHNLGAWRAMRAQLPPGEDPEVFRLASPGACAQCIRLWGDPGNPNVYRLSVLERNTFAGGNVGRKADEYVPTLGPTHPRCRCSGVLYHTPGMGRAIADSVDQIMAAWEAEDDA